MTLIITGIATFAAAVWTLQTVRGRNGVRRSYISANMELPVTFGVMGLFFTSAFLIVMGIVSEF